MTRHLVDDINGICDQYQSKSALHTRLLFIQRVQMAMNRERLLYRRKLVRVHVLILGMCQPSETTIINRNHYQLQ
jgi:hypothetical protein